MKLPSKLLETRDEKCPNCVVSRPEGFIVDERANAIWKTGFNSACKQLLPLIKKSLIEFEYYKIDHMVYQIKERLGEE